MNSQLFVVTGASQIKPQSQLIIGELGLYALVRDTGEVVNAEPTTNADVIYAATKRNNGVLENSRHIDAVKFGARQIRTRNLLAKKMVYREPVSQSQVLTSTCLGNSSFDEFSIDVDVVAAYSGSALGIGNYKQSYSVVGKFKTHKGLYQALAAEILKQNPFFSSVKAGDEGLTLVTREQLKVSLSFIFTNDPENECPSCEDCSTEIQILTDGDVGSGTPDYVTTLSQEWSIWAGHEFTQDRRFKVSYEQLNIDGAAKYDLYYLRWTNGNQIDESQTEAAFNQYQQLIIAVPTDTDMNYFVQTVERLVGIKFETV